MKLQIPKIEDKLKKLYINKFKIEDEIRVLEKEYEQSSLNHFILKDAIYLKTTYLSNFIINELKNIATFDNPQIKTLLSLRKPIYNTPKILKGYSEDMQNSLLILPRGLMREVIIILKTNNINSSFKDSRFYKKEIFPKIIYKLRDKQIEVCNEIIKKDFCLAVAPPGFGKTLLAAEVITKRSANTLIIVHKNVLLDQWINRFVEYFDMDKKNIGYLGKSKNILNGKLDIATMQSLKNKPNIIKNYSFVIVDECHHIPAITFERILKQYEGKYILGLSATPNRKDGMQPIIFQQLGSIAYEVKKERIVNNNILKIVNTKFSSNVENFSKLITELINNKQRNHIIIEQVKLYKNRKILLLTDRIEHIENLEHLLDLYNIKYISIHGSQKKNEQKENMKKINNASLVLATTSYFGEGIDFVHLNTIILATPISYHGRLVQYLGRIGRDGTDSLAIDIVDSNNPFTASSYKKRKEGYNQLHYKLIK
jgi:superfamily II DNA or RNA helicase